MFLFPNIIKHTPECSGGDSPNTYQGVLLNSSYIYFTSLKFEYPIKSSSTVLAAFLPSRIAQTTND